MKADQEYIECIYILHRHETTYNNLYVVGYANFTSAVAAVLLSLNSM